MANIYVLVNKLDGETIIDSAYSKKEEAYKTLKKIFKEKIVDFENGREDIVSEFNLLLRKKMTDEVYDKVCELYNTHMNGNREMFNLENTLYIVETKLNPQNEMKNLKNKIKNHII